MSEPLRVGIIGMGGFARDHHWAVSHLEAAGVYRLRCTCDPEMAALSKEQQELRFSERGVRLFTDYREMLEACGNDLDVVTIPTPIPLHAPMHRACVERGLAVYLEKPPTLNYAELEQMIATDAAARFKTMVGFNYIVEPERQALKQRLVDGEFGSMRRVGVWALWPRNTSYYGRAAWPGRLMLDGRLVLDSPIGNAMAHWTHNLLFWSGCKELWEWGTISRVSAEMYRAHQIEGMDTVFINASTTRDIEMRIVMSHACTGQQQHEEIVECSRANIRYYIFNSGPGGILYQIEWDDGRVETGGPSTINYLESNLRHYAAYLQGKVTRPLTRLADCVPFVQINDLAYLAARRITPVTGADVKAAKDGYLEIVGLPEAAARFMSTGDTPAQQRLPWAVSGGSATPTDLPKLYETVKGMVGNYELRITNYE